MISPTLTTIGVSLGYLAQSVFAQQQEYAQCGGIGWTGSTICASPYVCTYENDYYYQCLPGTGSATTTTKTTTSTSKTTTSSPAATTTASSGTSRTSPPSGCLVVRSSGATSGQYTTISAAVSALGSSSNSACIFIYSGTYNEQVYITHPGALTIYGYTTNTASYSSNTVTISAGATSTSAGSDDASGTLRVHTNNFKMYNINVVNTYGSYSSHTQAIALSSYGSQLGYYACSFKGYQDTLLANTGTQYFGDCYIEGAVDFIFGQDAEAYFKRCTVASSGPGCVTASGRSTNDASAYVFDSCTVTKASDAVSQTSGAVYLGRPWSDYARVVFKYCYLDSDINPAGWSQWSSSEPNTDHITFAEYENTGPESGTSQRKFATILTSDTYTESAVLGSTSWIDTNYS